MFRREKRELPRNSNSDIDDKKTAYLLDFARGEMIVDSSFLLLNVSFFFILDRYGGGKLLGVCVHGTY